MIPCFDISEFDPLKLVGHGAGFFFTTLPSTSGRWTRSYKTAVRDSNGAIIGYKQILKFSHPSGSVADDIPWTMCEYTAKKQITGFGISKIFRKGKDCSEVALDSDYFRAVKNSLTVNTALPTFGCEYSNKKQMIGFGISEVFPKGKGCSEVSLDSDCFRAVKDSLSLNTTLPTFEYRLGVDGLGIDIGWVFSPSDADLVSIFLKSKLQFDGYTYPLIPYLGAYDSDMANLFGPCGAFLFYHTKPCSLGSTTVDGDTFEKIDGTWVQASKRENIKDDRGGLIGSKRQFNFVPSKPLNEDVSWVMIEYQLLEGEVLSELVLSKIHIKWRGVFDRLHCSMYMDFVKRALHLHPLPPIHPSEIYDHATENAVVTNIFHVKVDALKPTHDVDEVVHEDEEISALLHEYSIEDVSLNSCLSYDHALENAVVEALDPLLVAKVVDEDEEISALLNSWFA